MTITALDRIGLKLARDKAKEAPPPATSGLGEAIENLIRQQVEEQVAAEAAKQQKPNPRIPPHRQPFTNREEQHTFPPPPPPPPPPPQAKPIKDLTVSFQRDATGKPIWAQVGDVKFEIQRGPDNRITRMVQVDEAPTLPPLPTEPTS